jgi:hypothetical protein
MSILPKFDQFVEVFSRGIEDAPHIAATGISRPHGIGPAGSGHGFSRFIGKLDDDLSFRIESVHMARLVILEIRDKPDTVEPN